jgi:hypothetical protein
MAPIDELKRNIKKLEKRAKADERTIRKLKTALRGATRKQQQTLTRQLEGEFHNTDFNKLVDLDLSAVEHPEVQQHTRKPHTHRTTTTTAVPRHELVALQKALALVNKETALLIRVIDQTNVLLSC